MSKAPDSRPKSDDHLVSAELIAIAAMNEQMLDELPFGAIRLDREGFILGYNRFESRLSGLEPTRVIGRNFFTQVAPCTNVKEFAGRFREGVARGELHVEFPYVFTFNPPRQVLVTLYFHKPTGNSWVLVKTTTV